MNRPSESADERAHTRGPSPRLSRGIAAVLAGLAVLALVAIVLELSLVRPRLLELRAEQQARTEAVRVAEHFGVQFNTFSADDISGFQKSMDRILSTKAETKFADQFGQLTQAIQATKMESEGSVLSSAVASIDGDSAEVLVVCDAAVESAQGPLQRHFRLEVALVKVDGRWLVDEFVPVT